MALLSLLGFGCTNLRAKYDARLLDEHRAQPLVTTSLLEEAALAHLPPPVQRFVRRSGAVGRPRVQNFRAEFEAKMFRKPGGAAMPATSVQVNFLARPTRLFHMKARMAGLPVQAYHVYADAQATFRVRVASLVDVVDQKGDVLSEAETVTVLNDMCFFAPGSLVDPRIGWEPIDDRTVKATFTNGPRRGSAVLHFNERDELVDFVSEDRPEFRDGEYRRHPWSTPIEGYRVIDGLRLPTRGAAVYKHPEGDFTYGRFVLKSIAFDVRPGVAP
jgi:hypothetical protein